MGIISTLGREYLAGRSLDEGIETAERLFHHGIDHYRHPISSTVDILGEEAVTESQVETNLQAYTQIIKGLGRLTREQEEKSKAYGIRAPFTVSVKLSAISLSQRKNGQVEFDERVSLEQNVRSLMYTGTEERIPITADMEDHYWTHLTLTLARHFWNGSLPLDIVLQSCLHQTLDDVDTFLSQNLPFDKATTTVRSCRGIYREPPEVATTDPQEAKERLYALVEKLFNGGYFVGIATHDAELQRRIREEIINKQGIPKNRYEYQGLKGVYSFEDVILPEALANRENVRLYLPVELKPGDGGPYMRRRVMMNREIALNYINDRMGRMWRQMWGKMPQTAEPEDVSLQEAK